MRFVIILFLSFALMTGCVVNPTTGEKKFAPIEAIKAADESIPDETKAMALEELAVILAGIGGAGAVGAPICYGAAAYFRNRKKKQEKVV